MTAAPAPDVTYRTDATDEEFAARIAAFDGEAAPESFDATVERAAEAFINEGFGGMQMDDLRRLAAAAIAALPAHPAEEAVRRVEALHFPLVEDLDSDPRCWEDGDRWPCATARAIRPLPADAEGTGEPVVEERPRRYRACAEAFGIEGQYDPACCRFPKSCSPYPYQEAIDAGNVTDADLEDPR